MCCLDQAGPGVVAAAILLDSSALLPGHSHTSCQLGWDIQLRVCKTVVREPLRAECGGVLFVERLCAWMQSHALNMPGVCAGTPLDPFLGVGFLLLVCLSFGLRSRMVVCCGYVCCDGLKAVLACLHGHLLLCLFQAWSLWPPTSAGSRNRL